MAAPRQEGDFRCTIERQTTWGTPVDSAPLGLPCADLAITHEGDEHKIDVDRGQRFDHEDDSFTDTAATIPVARCSMPITSGILKTLLPGLLQVTTDWSPATNVYTVYPTAPATLPRPRLSNEGYFYTLTRKSPTSSQSERISDAVIRSLKLSLHPSNNKGVLWGEFEWVGTTYSHSANPSGSIAQDSLAATVRYSWGDLDSVLYDGGASLLSDLESFEASLTWGAKLAGDTPRGEMLFPRFEANVTAIFGQNTQTQACEAYSRAQAISTGRPLIFRWGDGTVSSAGEFDLTFFTKVLPNGFDDSDRAEGEKHKVSFGCLQGGTASEYPVTFKYFAS